MEGLAQRLREKRKERGLTLVQVGERIDLSISFLSDIEVGRANPSLDTLANLAKCYDTSVSELCAEAEGSLYVKQVRIRMLELMIHEISIELETLKSSTLMGS